MDLVRWICVWYPCVIDLSEDPFLHRLLQWARCQDGLAAMILTGSRARKHATIDAASDYDMEIFLAEPARYGLSSEWLEEISPVWVYIDPSKDNAGEGNEEVTRLVFFAGGTKADLRIRPAKALTELAEDGLDNLYSRGYVVLADPSGLASRLPASSGHSRASGLRPMRTYSTFARSSGSRPPISPASSRRTSYGSLSIAKGQ